MWNLYLIFGTFCIVILLNSLAEAIIIKKRYKRSNVDNVLLNTSPPTVIKELQHGIKFFSDEVLRLKCNIDGNPKPSYQWYVSTSEVVDMSSNMQELQFEKVLTGTNYILDINGTESNKKFFKYSYFCLAQNPLGVLHSNKIIVEKVSKPKEIQIKYTSYHVDENEKFVIQCHTVPDSWAGLFKFKRWEIRLKPGHILHLNKTEGRYSVITSTKMPQLHIRNVTKEDFERTKVRCIFQSTVNNGIDVTESLFKQVEKLTYEAPSYLSNKCGSAETITASVENNIELPWCSMPKTLNVTWFKIENVNNKIELATKSDDPKFQMVSRRYGNLLILNATKEDSGKYMVITTGKFKPISLIYTVNVYESAIISLTPSAIQKELHQEAEFHCKSTYAKSQFYWLHNGRKVTSGYDDGNVNISSSIFESVLRIKKTRLSVTGVYQCIAAADNELKAISEYRQHSASLLLSKVPPLLYKQSPRVEKDTNTAQMQMSNVNKQKTIECVFAANPKPNIDWYLNSQKVPIKSLFTINIQDDHQSIYNSIAKLTINLDEVINEDDKRNYAGEYQAVASNELGTASCKTFVLMDGPLELRLPDKQTAVGGKNYLLSCYFIAMGVPEFSWDRKTSTGVWESMPSNHRTTMRDKNHKLLLKNVIKTADEGDYRCTAKFNRETKIAITNLEVANPPSLQRLPLKQDISENYYHMCTLNNKADAPWYVWWTFSRYGSNETKEIEPNNYNADFNVNYDFKKDEKSHEKIDGVPSFVLDYPNSGVNLKIKERLVDKSHLGKFTCHAKNHIGSAQKSIEDNFLSLEFQIIPPSTSEVVVGNDLYLNCAARDSDLKPFTRWRISSGDKYININNMTNQYGGRIYQHDNGTLVMKNIRETDPSRMFCFIIPSRKNYEVQSKVAYIDIRVPARVQPMAKEIFKVVGNAFNLSCNVYGNTHKLFVTFFYKSNDQWEELCETCIYSRENPSCMNQYSLDKLKFNIIIQSHNISYHTVNLEYQDTIESLTGQYKCKAKNKFNKFPDETKTQLIIISKPSKVIDFEQKSSTSTEIDLQWSRPMNNGNRPILGYLLKYSEKERRNISEISFKINDTVFSKKIDNLRPFRTYEITIAAENEVGIGEISNISVVTQEAQPERPVRGLKASSTQPHEILITWDDPESQYQNGKIIHYRICYQIIPTVDEPGTLHVSKLSWPSNLEESNDNSNVKCQITKEPTLTVPYLPQFTDFGIRVTAFNAKGPSPPAFTKVRTLEDLPQAAPTDLICGSQQQTIQLSWNAPGRQTINGVLIGYVVQYYKPNKYGDESDMLSVNVQGTTSVMLNELYAYTGYSIQVMAANRKGLGPPSARIICTTTEAKPEAPEKVKAFRMNATCIAVSWLHTSRPHGKIIEYCVIGTGFSGDKTMCQPPDFNKRYNYMILCDISDKFITIKVFARNKHDGAPKKVLSIAEDRGIISIGGQINVNEGSSILLLCETSKDDYQHVIWKRDNLQISNNENPNLKIYLNNSLEIKSIEKYGHHTYSCAVGYNSIDYNLNILDSPDGLPRPPYINDARVTENSIFISWKSKGTTDIYAPITGFTLTWENRYNHESKVVSLDSNTRTFYLNNVTCASEFHFKIRSINAAGQSEPSNLKILKTLGIRPQIADSAVLLPMKNIESNSANFNLNAFGPGDNCSAIYFTIEISLTSMGHHSIDTLINKNLTIYELENKCCYKITGLNPLTSYKYKVMAYNPAGWTENFNSFRTIAIYIGFPQTKYITVVPDHPFNQTWLLMIILIIAVIFIMVFLVLGVLYIVRNKEKRTRSIADTLPIRKAEFNQPRVDRTNFHDDTTSIDSNGEPSPYAVYQPDADPKTNHIWSQQVSQTSSTPGYNYPDHLYNQIRYDKIHQFNRPMQESQGNMIRRVNSAECLSSVGNASVSGIADLESPSNIDPNNRHGPFGRGPNNDDVFQNIQFPSCSTVNRSNKRVRRESENLRYPEEERINLVNQNPTMMMNWRNDPISFRNQQQPVYNKSVMGNSTNKRCQYRPQLSVPEPMPICSQQYGYPFNRQRTHSGVGSSQVTIPTSASQVNSYGNYYETHCTPNAYPNAKRDNHNSIINTTIEPYSKYVPTNHLSNYASQQRTTAPRQEFIAANGNVPRPSRNECSDDEIYTDRVVVV